MHVKNWRKTDGRLTRDIQLENFEACIGLVNQIAVLAEEINHHPDLLVHSYNQIRISLFTHSENRITDLDYLLAGKIENLLAR